MVGSAAVRPLQSRTHHERPNPVVNVPTRVGVPARIDDRNRAERAATGVHATGFVQDPQRIRVCGRAFPHDVRVGIESTDRFVELDEPPSVNHAIVEGLQTVLHAHVVERSARQARRAVAPDKVDQIVVKAAAYSVGPVYGVIDQFLGNHFVATARLDQRRRVRPHPALTRRPGRESRNGLLLILAPVVRTAVNCPCQQRAIRDRRGECHSVRVACARNDAVQETGIVLGNQVLLHRTARSSHSNGVDRNAETLDEVLLHHHRGLS